MNMRKFNIVGVLCLWLGISAVAAQEQTYLSVNQQTADKIAEQVLDQQKGATPENIGWAKGLIQEAFRHYFADKSVRANVYDEATMNKLEQEKAHLLDSIKGLHKENKGLTKQLSKENIQGQLDDLRKQLNQECENKLQEAATRQNASDDSLALQGKRIARLNQQLDSLQSVLGERDALVAKLKENARIADNVIAQHNARKDALAVLYQEIANSQTLDYVDENTIQKAIADYAEYTRLVSLPVGEEERTQMAYLETAAQAGKLYREAKTAMAAKYDVDKRQTLLKACEQFQTQDSVLNSGQRTVLAQVQMALDELDKAITHFRLSIIDYLKEQGQIPDQETATEVKEGIWLRVGNFAEGRYTDRKHYSPYHTHLNKVLDEAIEGLKIMNEKDYETFVNSIEMNL